MASCSKYWLLSMLMYPQVLGNGNSQHLSSSEIVCSQNDDQTATGLLHPNMSAFHQQEHCCFLILHSVFTYSLGNIGYETSLSAGSKLKCTFEGNTTVR